MSATIHRCIRIISNAIRKEKPIKGLRMGEEVKLSLIAGNMIEYLENPKINDKNFIYNKRTQ